MAVASSDTQADAGLPEPLVPADCDLRGIEPPWADMIDFAVTEHGADRGLAEEFVGELRRDWLARQ
ncbi:MAG TPA: hypothetical protein VF655_00080 [Allosphingosinicella sp.]|jgi:hypothetical protein